MTHVDVRYVNAPLSELDLELLFKHLYSVPPVRRRLVSCVSVGDNNGKEQDVVRNADTVLKVASKYTVNRKKHIEMFFDIQSTKPDRL